MIIGVNWCVQNMQILPKLHLTSQDGNIIIIKTLLNRDKNANPTAGIFEYNKSHGLHIWIP